MAEITYTPANEMTVALEMLAKRINLMEDSLGKLHDRLCKVESCTEVKVNIPQPKLRTELLLKYLDIADKTKRQAFPFLKCEVRDVKGEKWEKSELLAFQDLAEYGYVSMDTTAGVVDRFMYCRILPFTKENQPPEGCPMNDRKGDIDFYHGGNYDYAYWKFTGFDGAWFKEWDE